MKRIEAMVAANIVYRVGGDGFDGALFAGSDEAEYVGQIRQALYNSNTWGEFRRQLPAGEWEQNLAEKFEFREDPIPADDEPFAADCVPGHADGDYPEWLQQNVLEWFPEELIEKDGGRVHNSIFNGEFLELPGDKAEAIADELRVRGYTVERTDLDIS